MTKKEKKKLAKFLADAFVCPCNNIILEKEIQEYCTKEYKHCVDDNAGCWLRVINKIMLDGEEE